jgi:hypothetical protein
MKAYYGWSKGGTWCLAPPFVVDFWDVTIQLRSDYAHLVEIWRWLLFIFVLFCSGAASPFGRTVFAEMRFISSSQVSRGTHIYGALD